ncbi:hypothetical protein ACIOTI_43345 [Streptomyces sp. NPDC087843]|uniref:hypothetical protein n=1 Tax=Streptomyces sp. NPDC087843 TaxID=3365804 RepID=UPI0037F6B985
MDWAELLTAGALWHRLSEYRDIPAGMALAHVVVAAEGAPVEVTPGPVAELLGRAIGALLPVGEGAKGLALAEPGFGEPAADLVLVLVPCGRSGTRPSINALARHRCSTRANRPAMRPIRISSCRATAQDLCCALRLPSELLRSPMIIGDRIHTGTRHSGLGEIP